MASQRDVKNKIASVKNIQKITRAMEMVAAAEAAPRRAADRRPAAVRGCDRADDPSGGAGRRRARPHRCRCCASTSQETNVGLLLVTGDRGLAGGFNSQIIRAGVRLSAEVSEQGLRSSWYATGRRGVSSLSFRGYELKGSYTGFADRPAYADARTIADDVIQAYINGVGRPRGDDLQLLRIAAHPARDACRRCCRSPTRRSPRRARTKAAGEGQEKKLKARSTTSRIPKRSCGRLVPDYIEISIYRVLVESAAGFFGAQMTAMRSASENAGEIITDYTLQMNRARQAEITQEIMEVVAGAEGRS